MDLRCLKCITLSSRRRHPSFATRQPSQHPPNPLRCRLVRSDSPSAPISRPPPPREPRARCSLRRVTCSTGTPALPPATFLAVRQSRKYLKLGNSSCTSIRSPSHSDARLLALRAQSLTSACNPIDKAATSSLSPHPNITCAFGVVSFLFATVSVSIRQTTPTLRHTRTRLGSFTFLLGSPRHLHTCCSPPLHVTRLPCIHLVDLQTWHRILRPRRLHHFRATMRWTAPRSPQLRHFWKQQSTGRSHLLCFPFPVTPHRHHRGVRAVFPTHAD